MRIKAYIYRFATDKYLVEKAKRNSEIVDKSTDKKKRMKAVKDDFAIMDAIAWKERNNEEFAEFVKKRFDEFLEKYQ